MIDSLEQGNIQNGDNSSTNQLARLRSGEYYSCKDYDFLITPYHYLRLYLVFYDENKIWDSTANIEDTDILYINKSKSYFRCVIIDRSDLNSWSTPISVDDVKYKVFMGKYNFNNFYKNYNNIKGIEKDNNILFFINDLEAGNIQEGVPNSNNYAARVRTKNFYLTKDYDKIISNYNFIVFINYYDSDNNDTYQTTSSKELSEANNEIIINKNYSYFKIVFIDFTEANYLTPITPYQVRSLAFLAKTTNETEASLSQIKKEIDNKITILDNKNYLLHNKGYNVTAIYDWEQGNIQDGIPNNSSYEARVRTKNFYLCKDYKKLVTIKTTLRLYLTFYNSDYIYLNSIEGNGELAIDQSATYFKSVIIDRSDLNSWSTPITPDDVITNIFLVESIEELNENGDAVPNYFKTQLETVSNDALYHSASVGKNGVSFIFCTDLHWSVNQKHSAALMKEVINNTLINTIILGGDYINQFNGGKEYAITNMRDCISKYWKLSDRVFPIFGNHDRNSNGTPVEAYMTEDEAYIELNRWINPIAKYADDDYFSYYFDDEKSNTRFIIFKSATQSISSDITDSTINWVESKVLELPKNWHVILASHWITTGQTSWDHPMDNDGTYTGRLTNNAKKLFDKMEVINNDSTKCTIECGIFGHIHCDVVMNDLYSFPIIFTDTDGNLALGIYPFEEGTVNEQCFDIITIDYNNKTVYCDRIGRGVSREVNY